MPELEGLVGWTFDVEFTHINQGRCTSGVKEVTFVNVLRADRAIIEFVISVETPFVGLTLDVYFCSTAASALALASARAAL
jgi:hypothetical protein